MTDCPACGASCEGPPIFSPGAVPLARYGLVASPAEAADAPRFPVEILRCPRCWHAFNRAFRGEAIDYRRVEISEARSFSPALRQYVAARSLWLRERIPVAAPRVVEVGCGGGEFLQALAALSDVTVVGIDPSLEAAAAASRGLPIVSEAFDPESPPRDLAPDLVLARQFLEHVADPAAYLRAFGEMVAPAGGRVYLEVPNADRTFSRGRFSDLYYDHAGFFGANSLAAIVRRADLSLLELGTAWDGEILWCLVAPVSRRDTSLELARSRWEREIRRRAEAGERVAVWGASGSGTMFLNACRLGQDVVGWVVDSDPRKHGRIVPGTAQPVIAPGQLVELRPDVVVILSQLHRTEIEAEVRRRLGGEVTVLMPEQCHG